MAISYGDRLIDAGHYDITPEQEREIEARKECARRCIGPDEICADGGVLAWMVVDQELRSTRGDRGWALSHDQCPKCGGDCSASNPPVTNCPMVGCNKDF